MQGAFNEHMLPKEKKNATLLHLPGTISILECYFKSISFLTAIKISKALEFLINAAWINLA